MHDVESESDPEHCFPPKCGPICVLERVLVPKPHVIEHDPHELQSLQEQSTAENGVFNMFEALFEFVNIQYYIIVHLKWLAY